MATAFEVLTDYMKQQGQAHVTFVETTIPKKKTKTRVNVAKHVKFLQNLSWEVITTPEGQALKITSERIEGSLLDVTAEWLRLKGLTGQQYNAWAFAKSFAKSGVADVVFINNRNLKKVKENLDKFAIELQLKLIKDLTKNFTLADLSVEI